MARGAAAGAPVPPLATSSASKGAVKLGVSPRSPTGVSPHSPDSSQAPRFSNLQIRAAWRLLCGEGKRSVRRTEVEALMRRFFPALTSSEFDTLIGPIKGKMTLAELHTLLQSASVPAAFDPVLAAFRVFDQDHSSFLSKEELAHFVAQLPDVGRLSNEDLEVMMSAVDKDGDGKVSMDDFRVFLTDCLASTAQKEEGRQP